MTANPVPTPAGVEPAFDIAAYYPILIYAVVVFPLGRQVASAQAEAGVQRDQLTRARQDYLAAIGEFNKAQYALQRATGGLGGATNGGR